MLCTPRWKCGSCLDPVTILHKIVARRVKRRECDDKRTPTTTIGRGERGRALEYASENALRRLHASLQSKWETEWPKLEAKNNRKTTASAWQFEQNVTISSDPFVTQYYESYLLRKLECCRSGTAKLIDTYSITQLGREQLNGSRYSQPIANNGSESTTCLPLKNSSKRSLFDWTDKHGFRVSSTHRRRRLMSRREEKRWQVDSQSIHETSPLLKGSRFEPPQTITTSSLPRKRKGNWSIIAWTVSSRCGRIISKRTMSVNSYGSRVGHQQIARFFESMLLALQFSVTLLNARRKEGSSWVARGWELTWQNAGIWIWARWNSLATVFS